MPAANRLPVRANEPFQQALLSEAFLGITTTEKIKERAKTPILTIGVNRYFRRDFGKLDVYNFSAAQNLGNRIKALEAKSTRDLFERFGPRDLAIPGLGVYGMAMLSICFQLEHLGGEKPLGAWTEKHKAKAVTWHTTKHKIAVELAEERADLRRRKSQRKDQAHELRVERFDAKTEAAKTKRIWRGGRATHIEVATAADNGAQAGV